jgi:hypothetical protein
MANYTTKSYVATEGGHRIEFEFDKTAVIVNRARLFVDGRELDKKTVHYGETNVRGVLDDGRELKVEFGSGFVGQLKHLDATIDGQPIELVEEEPTAAA